MLPAKWFEENDPEGVAFEYEVLQSVGSGAEFQGAAQTQREYSMPTTTATLKMTVAIPATSRMETCPFKCHRALPAAAGDGVDLDQVGDAIEGSFLQPAANRIGNNVTAVNSADSRRENAPSLIH